HRLSPAMLFWSAGGVSAVLDNAPTYLGFLNALSGAARAKDISQLLLENAPGVLAISVAAVFFGAVTYIGNGPNFFVKAVADRRKVPTPSFIGYVLQFALPVLAPVFVMIWWLFFSG
ncbi:MAG: sodium:proton antiporter, partial [Verrucomicrobia bacterium]|nr:sodium:proton antiporter [Verrucomicrobiota bacterium]